MPDMTSTPNLEEAANAAESSLTDQNKPNEDTATDSRPQDSQLPTKENDESGEQFTAVKFDDLPEELRGTYKSLQADYTRKRQKESAEIKELRDKLAAVEAGRGQKQAEQARQPLPPQNPIQRAVQQEFAAQRAEQMYQKELDYIENAHQEYIALDERLNGDLPSYDAQMANSIENVLATERGKYEQEHNSLIGFDFIGRTKQLVKEWDDYINKQHKDYIERQKILAKKNSDKSRVQNPQGTAAAGKKAGLMTVDEAMTAALEEMNQ